MRSVLCLSLLATVVLAEKLHPLSNEFINQINSKQSTWTAGRNFEENTPISEIKKLLGTKRTPRNLITAKKFVHNDDGDIPESFDAREHWPECKDVISLVADQSDCGSCWAVAAASAMSDRRCIASKGELKVQVSAEDLTSCCYACGYGCEGGYPQSAWSYWYHTGIVTGGPFNNTDGCRAYSMEPCEHHMDGDRKQCSEFDYKTPACVKKCDSATKDYKQELTFAAEEVNWFKGVQNIQRELLKNGPLETDFDVYEDFVNYKSGVYQYTTGQYLGGHAVRLLGWGVENDVPYWLIANSWNSDWGEQGHFKIIRGQDEVGIESEVFGARPKV